MNQNQFNPGIYKIAQRGGEVAVPLPDGTEVFLSLPPGTSHKRVFRLLHQGMPLVHSSSRGHLYVQILVVEGVGHFSTRRSASVPQGKQQQDQSRPKVLGNYRLLNILGEGGFATVYLAEHVHLKTFAAVKLLRGKINNEDSQHFQQEARTIAGLRHPHIIRMLDFGVDEKSPYLIMEYAVHGTLRERHEEGKRVPLATVLVYVEHLADALQYAHNRNLVHRDIKPANMLIGQDNTLLLSDFGLAMRAHKTQSLSTQDAIGTISYMAPEQIRGKPRFASDQYALAVVVYEWLCGKCPFDGDTAIDIAMKHIIEPPPSLCEQVSYLPSEVEEVVFRALAKNPSHRFEDVSSFAEALIDVSTME